MSLSPGAHPWHCTLCKTSSTSAVEWRSHLIGKTHKKNLATEARQQAPPSGTLSSSTIPSDPVKTPAESNQPNEIVGLGGQCLACDFSTKAERNWKEHIAGKRHRRTVKRLMSFETETPKEALPLVNWRCKLCDLIETDGGSWPAHVSSKEHQQRLVTPPSGAKHKVHRLKRAHAKTLPATPLNNTEPSETLPESN